MDSGRLSERVNKGEEENRSVASSSRSDSLSSGRSDCLSTGRSDYLPLASIRTAMSTERAERALMKTTMSKEDLLRRLAKIEGELQERKLKEAKRVGLNR